VLETCERDGLGFLPWFPLDTGSIAQHDELERIARAHSATSAQVALAWLMQHSPVIVPIPGTSSLAHLEENVAAASLRLGDEEMAQVEEAARS
jgi:pyridoxine 4-dehydrogenase